MVGQPSLQERENRRLALPIGDRHQVVLRLEPNLEIAFTESAQKNFRPGARRLARHPREFLGHLPDYARRDQTAV